MDTLCPSTTLFRSLAHAGDGAHDERIEAAPDVAFPARHGRDIGLHGGVAVGLRDLRVAACEEGRRRSDPLGGGLLCDLRRLLGRGFGHRSEEHTSELQSLMRISYAVFCLTQK